ncbi:MAG: YebC/PmpR family DNA-binding transcriptional regulator [Planctomycetota bacterium]|nr:YebC/PmpR family DNA-binding transcriptional regulator [Planctomycetota bacterium]
MAGHSHWAGIKHKKGIADAKKGKIFSKLAQQIMVAVREGGSSVDTNLKLKYAIEKARAANMPKDNIERTIKRASGELGEVRLEEVLYEGYAPGGVAVLVEVLTDNRNRTTSELRTIFQRRGGTLSEKGSVAWMFDLRGMLLVEAEKISEDALYELTLEAGAEDVKLEGGMYEVYCAPSDFENVKTIFEKHGVKPKLAEVSRIPKTTITLDAETGKKVLGLLNALEEHDDVQNVYANYDIPEEVMEKVMEEQR